MSGNLYLPKDKHVGVRVCPYYSLNAKMLSFQVLTLHFKGMSNAAVTNAAFVGPTSFIFNR